MSRALPEVKGKIASPSNAYLVGAQAAKDDAVVAERKRIARGSLSFFDMAVDDYRTNNLMSGVTLT